MTFILAAALGLTPAASAAPWTGPSICDTYPEACVFDQSPDLTITDMVVECGGFSPVVRVTVENNGLPSASAYVDVFFGEPVAPPMGAWGEVYKYVTVPGFSTKVVTIDIGHNGESGWFDAIVDTDDYVDESNESNNTDYIWASVPEYCLG